MSFGSAAAVDSVRVANATASEFGGRSLGRASEDCAACTFWSSGQCAGSADFPVCSCDGGYTGPTCQEQCGPSRFFCPAGGPKQLVADGYFSQGPLLARYGQMKVRLRRVKSFDFRYFAE
jgi:hypothetical protein